MKGPCTDADHADVRQSRRDLPIIRLSPQQRMYPCVEGLESSEHTVEVTYKSERI
jgi:hypothetical protein